MCSCFNRKGVAYRAAVASAELQIVAEIITVSHVGIVLINVGTRMQGVFHRDLKLENTLIDRQPNSAPRLKICDFGYSKVQRSGHCLHCHMAVIALQLAKSWLKVYSHLFVT